MTYQDVPQLDLATTGATMHVTINDFDRTQQIIDPHTGALIRRVSLPQDFGWYVGFPPYQNNHAGPFMFFGGSTKVCANSPVGPDNGIFCSFAQGDGGIGGFYYILPSGDVRFLGESNTPYPLINPVTGTFFGAYADQVYSQAYAGDFQAAAPESHPPLTTTTIRSGLGAAIHDFDNAFDPTAFSCGPDQFEGIYAVFTCGRGGQDSYGWLAVMDVTNGSIVAAMQVYQNDKYHWTGLHHTDSMYDAAGMILTTHSLVGSTGGGSQLGLGPYLSTYTGTTALPVGSTSITVSGEPTCIPCGPDPNQPLAQAGDLYSFKDASFEHVTLITKNSATSWTISPTTSAHDPGVQLQAEGNYTQFVWKFLLDPHGKDTTGTGIVSEMQIDGHDDIVHNLLLMESYYVRVGDLLDMAGKPWTRVIDSNPLFAGAFGQCYGNGCASHPSGAAAQPWFTDSWRWDGAYAVGGTTAPISGQLYQFSGVAHNMKHLPQAAAIGAVFYRGPFGLTDASGPGVILSDTPADQYKYVVANAPGEGHAGSNKGDVFVNLPPPVASPCGALNAPCINNFAAYGNAVLQIGIDGAHTRVISGGLGGLSDMGGSSVAKATADGQWLLFNTGDTHTNPPTNLFMAKLPPFAAEDAVDRTTFIRASLSIAAPAGQGIASAAVEFGYGEQGGYCTSRREACVATSETVDDANPFSYATTDTYIRMPCATSCTITLPVLPMHVAHYQVKFYDASGAFVSNGISGLSVESKLF